MIGFFGGVVAGPGLEGLLKVLEPVHDFDFCFSVIYFIFRGAGRALASLRMAIVIGLVAGLGLVFTGGHLPTTFPLILS